MARQSFINNIDGSVDNNSVQNGFVSLLSKEEGWKRLGEEEKHFGDRQKELTEQGGYKLYMTRVLGPF